MESLGPEATPGFALHPLEQSDTCHQVPPPPPPRRQLHNMAMAAFQVMQFHFTQRSVSQCPIIWTLALVPSSKRRIFDAVDSAVGLTRLAVLPGLQLDFALPIPCPQQVWISARENLHAAF